MHRGCMKTGNTARKAARDAAASRGAEGARAAAAAGAAGLVWHPGLINATAAATQTGRKPIAVRPRAWLVFIDAITNPFTPFSNPPREWAIVECVCPWPRRSHWLQPAPQAAPPVRPRPPFFLR